MLVRCPEEYCIIKEHGGTYQGEYCTHIDPHKKDKQCEHQSYQTCPGCIDISAADIDRKIRIKENIK